MFLIASVMKKNVFAFSIFFVFLLSCQVEEEVSCKPTFVSEPPEEISGNEQAYIEAKDLQTVMYVGNFLTKAFFTYQDKGGNVLTYYLVFGDVYKIKASRYWNWFEGKEYVSSYKEQYEISAQTLSRVRERIKNMGAAICSRRVISSEENHISVGSGLAIVDVSQ